MFLYCYISAQHIEVVVVDIVQDRVDKVNNRQSPIQDDYIERFFSEDTKLLQGISEKDFILEKPLLLTATTDWENGYRNADFVANAAQTNHVNAKNLFDTSAVEDVVPKVQKVNPTAIMVIKSTIPVGYTESVRKKYNTSNIIFTSEFLCELKAFI